MAGKTENGVSRIALKALERFDNWQSALTGLGTARDKVTSFLFQPSIRIDDETLELIYHGDDMAARIINKLPKDMLKMGFSVNLISEENGEQQVEAATEVNAKIKELDVVSKFVKALIWGRLYGGAVVFLGAKDGVEDVSEPLREDNITSFDWLSVLDKREIIPIRWYSDPRHPKFGMPEVFIVQPIGAASVSANSLQVHESRFILFGGVITSNRKKRENDGWDDSVLQRVHDTLQMYHSNWKSVTHLVSDASQGVFKIKGLVSIIAGKSKELLETRMQMLDQSRSVLRAVMVDSESEDFTRVTTSFAGLPDIIDRGNLRLAAAAEMPVTVMMGQSPAGMNATGDSDIRLWYDQVQTEREQELQPKLERLVTLLFKSMGSEPESWEIHFPSLWQPTPKETAELRKIKAEEDAIYIDRQVLLPEEVAISRFRTNGWNQDTVIDLDSRREMMSTTDLLEEVEEEEVVTGAETETEVEVEDPDAADPTAAFNGAQVAALSSIMSDVISGALPRETASLILQTAFPLSPEEAQRLIDSVPEDFEGAPTPEPLVPIDEDGDPPPPGAPNSEEE